MTEQQAREIIAEAKSIFEMAKNSYYEARGNDRCSDTMVRSAEKSMQEAYAHLQEMRYHVAHEMGTYSVGNV